MLELVLHSVESRRPEHRVRAVARRSAVDSRHLTLVFEVVGGGALVWPKSESSESTKRRDELWKSTCFECFVAIPGELSYIEWNFSPDGRWQAYEFQAYRQERTNADVSEPSFEVIPVSNKGRLTKDEALRFEIDLELPLRFTSKALDVSLTAVAQESRDEVPFYWSLQHVGEKPDFHLRSGFALLLEK